MTSRIALLLASLFAVLSLSACVTGGEDGEPEGSEESEDYEPVTEDGKADGVPATFNQNRVIDNDVFIDDGTFTAAEVQRFLEKSPYGNRSWLADYTTTENRTAAQAIYAHAVEHGIHPITLLSRMQVEATLLSKTTRPTTTRINQALGCGCPDGSACAAQYRGFEAQLACGARTFKRWYNASADGTAPWRLGVTKKSLDNRSVRPANHATASLYSYTPWVLPGRGGAWLVWNVTKKYVNHAVNEGYIARPGADD